MALLASTLPAMGQSVLAWRLKAGDQFYLVSEHRTHQVMHFQEKDITQDLVNKTVSHIEVLSAQPEGVVLRQKMKSIEIQVDGPGAGDGAKLAQLLEGSTFIVTFDPHMQVSRLGGYDQLMQKLVGDNATLRKAISVVINEATLKEELNQAFGGGLPDGPVTPGSRWRRNGRVMLGPLGEFKTVGDFVYRGQSNDLDRVDAAWSGTYAPPAREVGLPFQVIRGDLRCESARGSYWFDLAAGRLAQAERRRDVRGTLTMAVQGGEMSVDLEQEVTITHRTLSQLPPKE
jgi:hypothetical protein